MADTIAAVELPVKPWYKSITLWVNVIGFLIISLEIILESNNLIDLPSQVVGVLTLILLLLNGWRRFITSEAIGRPGSTTVLTVPTAAVSLPSSTIVPPPGRRP